MVRIIGHTKEKLDRVTLGLWTLDQAFIGTTGETGIPLGVSIELYGPTHCGKSTITYSLSGMIAEKIGGSILLADFEGFDPPFLESVYNSVNYTGDVKVIQEKSDEKTLTLFTELLAKPKQIGIVDSVGAISPISEKQGDIGDANMGRRANMTGQLIRRSVGVLNGHKDPGMVFLINHVHQNIGFLGTHTVGGKALEYLAGIHVSLKKKEDFVGKNKEIVAYHTQGTVIKNKYGRRDKKFNLVVLAGSGIHSGLTAFIDCVELGLVKVERGVVRDLSGNKICRSSGLLVAAQEAQSEPFSPFYELLQSGIVVEPISDDEETNDER